MTDDDGVFGVVDMVIIVSQKSIVYSTHGTTNKLIVITKIEF